MYNQELQDPITPGVDITAEVARYYVYGPHLAVLSTAWFAGLNNSISGVCAKQKRSNSPKMSFRPLFALAGLFLCYVIKDALQEKIFWTDGYEFGYFMSFTEIGTVALMSTLFSNRFLVLAGLMTNK